MATNKKPETEIEQLIEKSEQYRMMADDLRAKAAKLQCEQTFGVKINVASTSSA